MFNHDSNYSGVGGFHLAEKMDSSLGLCSRFRRLELSGFKFFFEF